MRPLDCFAALAMTGGELARLFLGVALVWIFALLAMTAFVRAAFALLVVTAKALLHPICPYNGRRAG